jgi:hypothetical protein
MPLFSCLMKVTVKRLILPVLFLNIIQLGAVLVHNQTEYVLVIYPLTLSEGDEPIYVRSNRLLEIRGIDQFALFLNWTCIWTSDCVRDSTLIVVQHTKDREIRVRRRMFNKNYFRNMLQLKSHGARESVIWVWERDKQ